jgi:hypothetical protein
MEEKSYKNFTKCSFILIVITYNHESTIATDVINKNEGVSVYEEKYV